MGVMTESPQNALATHSWKWQSLPPLEVFSTLLPPPPEPRVLSLELAFKRPKVRTFRFTPPAAPHANTTAQSIPAKRPSPAETPAPSKKRTRIRPPADTVRLEDRLFYALQPTLEMILSEEALGFPHTPFPFQWDGIAFLVPRHAAVLADEMGLGKTMQAVTAVRTLLHTGELRRVLLVCPKPLITNWQREFGLWAPEIPLTVIAGDKARRQFQWRRPEAVVLLANYESLVRDRDEVTADGQHFDLVILDESQRIKNVHGTTNEVARSIPRTRSWALTGTPVENSLNDLVGIFEFLMPGYLSPQMKPRLVARATRDHVLRRTKDRVLTDLPPKLIRQAELELTPQQREAYQLAEEEGVIRLNEMGEALTIQHVFELVLRLKQICNFDPATGESSKFERLEADLEEVAASGRKAIVFSQWVETLQELSSRLQRFGPLEFHGKIPSAQREGVLTRFREDPRSHVILMSYGTGSVGLNLQFCEYVFLFDRWWNPAVEDQAINRAHRIGAAGPVTVTQFLTTRTIEERIDEVLREKRELFDTLFGDLPAPAHHGLNRQEIFGLFRLDQPDGIRRAA